MAKILKPIRFEEDMIANIEGVKGSNFTEKLEYILDDYFNAAPRRIERLNSLDKQIKDKKDTLDALQKKYRDIANKFNSFKQDISNIVGWL